MIERSSTGLLGRLAGSVVGIGFGLMLLLAGPALLFWNEGRAVKTATAIAEGASSVVSIGAERIDPANEGALVHLTARAEPSGTVSDEPFGVEVEALALERRVEMFQWKETTRTRREKRVGGREERVRTFSYEQVWSDKHLSSQGYREDGHANPPSMPFETTRHDADAVRVGAFTVDAALVASLKPTQPVTYTQDHLRASRWRDRPSDVELHDGGLYVGTDPATPATGDLRVQFQIAPPQTVSVLARQRGEVLGPHVTSNGYAVHAIRTGVHSPDGMFEAQASANNVLTWILRPVGFFVVFLGLSAVLGPLRVMADVIPFVGRLAGVVLAGVAFLGAAACSLPTIGLAWVFYRPLIGLALLAVGALALFGAVTLVAAAVAWSRRGDPA